MRQLKLIGLSLLLGGLGACSSSSSNGSNGGSGGAAGAAVPEDACNGVPATGLCLSASQRQLCAETSEAPLQVVTEDCETWEECTVANGQAACTTKAGMCATGGTRCDSGTVLATCNGSGVWTTTTCPDVCKTAGTGSYCDASVATVSQTYVFKYEARDIDRTTLNSWGDIFQVSAAGLQVASRRGNASIDTGVTDATGSVTLKVPVTTQVGDQVTVTAIRMMPGNASKVSVAMANPNLTEDQHATADAEASKQPAYWSWTWSLASPVPSPAVIAEADSSGVLRVFDDITQAMAAAESQFTPKPSVPLVVWMQPNVTWTCGSCHGLWSADIGPVSFDRQIWLPMDSVNQSYWSTAVVGHEFGHYVMGVWGTSPREAGRHCFGQHYPPGLGWSEGWATWYSAEWRRPSGIGQLYYAKQNGTFLVNDIENRTYSGGYNWVRPVVSDGLLQYIDENEVSAMSWTLSSSAIGAPPMYASLASARMNTSPFGRGYTRHSWSMNGCIPVNSTDTGTSIPMFADFLDGLVCAGAPAGLADTATDPTNYYPYPSASPICK